MHHNSFTRNIPAPCRIACSALGLAALLFAGATTAQAGSYRGASDTDWVHTNKRDCCEDAVWLAQEESINQCEIAGGEPRPRSGSTRGVCNWDARGSGRYREYRCTATATVNCR